MKLFYTISLLLFLSVGFAQNSKLKGIWVEYKREVIGDTNIAAYTLDGSPFNVSDVYEFENDSVYYIPNEADELYCNLSHDTLALMNPSVLHCDCNVWPHYYFYNLLILNESQLILSEVCDSGQFGYKKYFKKVKRHKKSRPPIKDRVDIEAKFPGGEDSLTAYIKRNIDTTSLIPIKSNHDVTVAIVLSINSSGKITEVEIKGHPSRQYAREIIRLVKLMPNWIPAQNSQILSSDINAKPKNISSEKLLYYFTIKSK